MVCIGGDGTVHKVMNGLMHHAQKDEQLELRAYSVPCRSPVPLGIIPTGGPWSVICNVGHQFHFQKIEQKNVFASEILCKVQVPAALYSTVLYVFNISD